MISQRPLDFAQHAAADTAVTDNYNGTQVMGNPTQFFPTFRIQDFLPLARQPEHSREIA